MCPCCRVDMVTDSEISKAATTLVGKERMIRAVATLGPSLNHQSPPASPTVSIRPGVVRLSPAYGVSPSFRRANGR